MNEEEPNDSAVRPYVRRRRGSVGPGEQASGVGEVGPGDRPADPADGEGRIPSCPEPGCDLSEAHIHTYGRYVATASFCPLREGRDHEWYEARPSDGSNFSFCRHCGWGHPDYARPGWPDNVYDPAHPGHLNDSP